MPPARRRWSEDRSVHGTPAPSGTARHQGSLRPLRQSGHRLVETATAGPPGPVLPWRGVGALGLLGTAAVHLWTWSAEDYGAIPTIGPLFLLTAAAATVLAVAVVTARRPLVDALGAGMALSVLVSYVLALTLPAGLFLFKEPGVSGAGALAIASEGAAIVSLVVAGAHSWWSSAGAGGRRRSGPVA